MSRSLALSSSLAQASSPVSMLNGGQPIGRPKNSRRDDEFEDLVRIWSDRGSLRTACKAKGMVLSTGVYKYSLGHYFIATSPESKIACKCSHS